MPSAPSRTRATALPPSERRAEIVAATLPLLLAHGAAVTTRQIAEAAGIAEGTIFRVFPDKESPDRRGRRVRVRHRAGRRRARRDRPDAPARGPAGRRGRDPPPPLSPTSGSCGPRRDDAGLERAPRRCRAAPPPDLARAGRAVRSRPRPDPPRPARGRAPAARADHRGHAPGARSSTSRCSSAEIVSLFLDGVRTPRRTGGRRR